MRFVATLMGRFFPGLGEQGSAGLPSPELLDMSHLPRSRSSNTALAAPAGFQPSPDVLTHNYDVAPEKVFAAAQAAVLAQPRTVLQREFTAALQAHYVVRSAVAGFPDLVMLQVLPAADKGSQFVIWSRSVYGRYDFGVNRKRLVAWLSAIDAMLLKREDL